MIWKSCTFNHLSTTLPSLSYFISQPCYTLSLGKGNTITDSRLLTFGYNVHKLIWNPSLEDFLTNFTYVNKDRLNEVDTTRDCAFKEVVRSFEQNLSAT